MKKRFRSLVVLATMVALVLSMSGIAFAQFSDVAKDAPYATHVELLNSLGIAKGYPDGTFGVNQPMTRQEFAVFVVRAMGKERLAEGFANNPTGFKDDKQIGDWARGAVYLASQMGIIAGYPDGTFKPQGNVTHAEALTMLVRALGFKKYAEDLGAWPVGYLLAADNLGITEGLTVFPNVPMVRSEMAIALANTLFATTAKNLDPTGLNDGSPNKDKASETAWIVTVWKKVYSRAIGVTGTVDSITTWNNTIVVGGKTYSYDPDTTNGVEVTVNGASPGWAGGTKGSNGISGLQTFLNNNPGTQVTVYAEGTKAKAIDVIYWNGKNAKLTAVNITSTSVTIDVNDRGTNKTGINISPNTKITIDGQQATAQQLKTAFQNAAGALVSIRVPGSDGALAAGNSAVEVAVLINNTVSGKVTATGTDVKGSYAVINGQKVYFDTTYGLSAPGLNASVVWLLGTDGVAYLDLSSTGPALTTFQARYVGSQQDTSGTTYTYQYADGSTVTGNTAPGGGAAVGDFVTYSGASYSKVTLPTAATGTSITKLSATSVKVGSAAYAIAPYGAWVDDQVSNTKKAYADWTVPSGINAVYLFFNSNGEVDLIVVTP
ncbi:MAG: S-layer homology domain-containing protein [Clostridiales bacterium]|nr:S-layer homology domain-containing protein [Clostridiales bacterium]